MTKTKIELTQELEQWGAKLTRTNNQLSERETKAFHQIQKDAIGLGLKDFEIDKALKYGRHIEKPQARYEEEDVPLWI